MKRDLEKLRAWQQRSRAPMTRTKLRPVSAKRRKIMPARKDCRETVFRRAGGKCEIRRPGVCTGACEQVHEVTARSQGGSITDPENCRGTCAPCHEWVTQNMNAARTMGLAT